MIGEVWLDEGLEERGSRREARKDREARGDILYSSCQAQISGLTIPRS